MEEKLQSLMAWAEKRQKELGQDSELPKAFRDRDPVEEDAKTTNGLPVPQASKVKLFIPGMDDTLRAMPNHIARSSLFAPVARGRKKMHDGTLLVSRGDAEIRYSGRQLDEGAADVWMQAIKEAQRAPLGTPITINVAEFLRALGRSDDGRSYKWLQEEMKDLAFGMLVIEVRTKGRTKYKLGWMRALHLIGGFDYDPERKEYKLTIDPRWVVMFSNREYALLDWDKRLQISRGLDMAKTLQREFGTSSDRVQRFSLEYLKAKMEYTSPMRKFREALTAACRELVRLGIIERWRIENSAKGNPQLVVWLKPS